TQSLLDQVSKIHLKNKMWPEATILHFLLLNPNKDDRP
ncbi:hypothetical protein Tco_1572963, partial [Tanacetum coccineum]